jgi:transcriptional regulator with XRE-family HTH domain
MRQQREGETGEPVLGLEETARRVRAARAYAGLSIPRLAKELGVGMQTIKRIESGRRSPRRYELWGIADICGLPSGFFERSFDVLGTERTHLGPPRQN